MPHLPVLPLSKINVFNHSQHHLISGYEAGNITTIADSLLGLHSARLPTPYVIIQPRMLDARTDQLYDEWYEHGNLMKLRCVRKTRHSASNVVAPILHQATLSLRLADIKSFYSTHRISPRRVESVKELILSVLKDGPQPISEILKSHRIFLRDIVLFKKVIKDLWECGTLCYVNRSQDWAKEDRCYGLTAQLYPQFNLSSIDEASAQEQLVYYYISAYGPVTINDIWWWSGIGKSAIQRSLVKLENSLIKVYLEGCIDVCYMTHEKYLEYLVFDSNGISWVALLAYEDSSLKGYFQTRFRYVDARWYHQTFNQIGEVRPTIIVNGRVAGVWRWDKQAERVATEFFYRLSHGDKRKIKERISAMECYLTRHY